MLAAAQPVYSNPLASPSNGHYYINSTCEQLTDFASSFVCCFKWRPIMMSVTWLPICHLHHVFPSSNPEYCEEPTA